MPKHERQEVEVSSNKNAAQSVMKLQKIEYKKIEYRKLKRKLPFS